MFGAILLLYMHMYTCIYVKGFGKNIFSAWGFELIRYNDNIEVSMVLTTEP